MTKEKNDKDKIHCENCTNDIWYAYAKRNTLSYLKCSKCGMLWGNDGEEFIVQR